MKLNYEQLDQHLHRQLLPVYLLSGDEVLLLQESLSMIREAARKQGFSNRERFFIEPRFQWDEVLLAANSFSLFAEKKIIELHFRQGKFLAADVKAVQALLSIAGQDTLLLIVMPRLETGVNRSAIYKDIDAKGITLAVWPVERDKLPAWISARLRRYNIQASSEAINYLADNTEGNLLATQQEIEKLYLMHQDKPIGLDDMMQAVSNSSRYTPFNYIDRCLQGELTVALRTLYGLRDEGNEAIVLLAVLSRELRNLYRLRLASENRQDIKQMMPRMGVFAMRQNMMQAAVRRLSVPIIQELLELAYRIDQSIKGLRKDSPWLLLEQATIKMCSK